MPKLTTKQRQILELWAAEYHKLGTDPSAAQELSEETRRFKLMLADALTAALAEIDRTAGGTEISARVWASAHEKHNHWCAERVAASSAGDTARDDYAEGQADAWGSICAMLEASFTPRELEGGTATGWQPIDDYQRPLEGYDLVLVARDDEPWVTAAYQTERYVWLPDGDVDDGLPGCGRYLYPTHFQRLPAPPAGASER